jgi:hypothetical protein
MIHDDLRGERTTVVHDHFPPELVRMCATASRGLDEHVPGDDLCAICGCLWPCASAVHNLALL